MWVDTHCHLFDQRFADDLDEVLARARAAGVCRVVVPGVDLPTSRQAVALAERYPEVYAAVGIHPEALAEFQPAWLDEVRDLARHPKVVAIGEIGLDYYWNVAPSDVQRRVFRAQLELAGDHGLPAVVHNREATADVVADVTDVRPLAGGVMHCFTADADTAERCVRAGFWISYGGPLTYKANQALREAAARVDAAALVVETDAPYLSPHPYRGQRNEPARVAVVGEKLAEVRGWTVHQTAARTTANALRLFPKLQT